MPLLTKEEARAAFNRYCRVMGYNEEELTAALSFCRVVGFRPVFISILALPSDPKDVNVSGKVRQRIAYINGPYGDVALQAMKAQMCTPFGIFKHQLLMMAVWSVLVIMVPIILGKLWWDSW